MRRLALLTLTVTALVAPSLDAQAPAEAPPLEARVWLDRGDEPVLRRGETVRIYYRATENAYAAIFRIDTDGRISLIYPQDPAMAAERLTGGVDYRMIFPNSPVWRVSDDPGVGYLFMVASPDPLDFSAFPFDPEYGWDLGAVGEAVYDDPYVAIDDYVALLVPGWEEVPYGLDFVTYSVGDTYTYPRFLCYDCHDARPYATWNPYAYQCTTYRVVVYDDPYFYPYYRYSGTALVVARPLVAQPRYAVAVRAPGDSYRPLIRTRTPPPRRATAEFKESPDSGPRGVGADALAPQRQPTGRPTLQRRPTPSPQLPVRTPPSTSGGRATPTPGRGPQDPTIVRPAPRPFQPGGSAAPRAPSRPSERVTPGARPSSPSSRPGAGSGTPSRPTVQPAPSRPRAQPTPSRPRTQPAPSRPRAQPTPSRPRTQPAPSRPRTQPAPSRPRAQPTPSARPSPPRQPAARPSAPPRSSSPQRPPADPRSRDPRRP